MAERVSLVLDRDEYWPWFDMTPVSEAPYESSYTYRANVSASTYRRLLKLKKASDTYQSMLRHLAGYDDDLA